MGTRFRALQWICRLFAALTASIAITLGATAAEQDLPEPKGEVILTIEGHISHENGHGKARFDAEMLKQLGWAEIKTETPWTEGITQFAGIPGAAILDAVGAGNQTVLAVALNDYSVEIPAEDFRAYGAIFAMEMNGKPLEVRDRGPLWVIYPWTENEATRKDAFISRSIWMLHTLEVLSE